MWNLLAKVVFKWVRNIISNVKKTTFSYTECLVSSAPNFGNDYEHHYNVKILRNVNPNQM